MEGSLKQLRRDWGSEEVGDSQAVAVLQELALQWFMETQAPLILCNGALPPWFHGFIARKQAEQRLRNKALGSFLIRLSDRATGYILSYKGSDRCRHFVIEQLQNRRYLVSGDTQSHGSLAELVHHYQEVQLEPFGETLATACPRPEDNDLYDAITLGLPPTTLDLQRPAATASPAGAPGRAGSPHPPPKPQASFLHAKKSLEGGPCEASKEESSEPLPRVPPVPERGAALLDLSLRGPGSVVYADLQQMKQMRPGLGSEASGKHDPAPAGSQDRPRSPGPALPGESPDQGPAAGPSPQSPVLPPTPEALGPSAATQSQGPWRPSHGAPPCSPDTYATLQVASFPQEASDRPGHEDSGTYAQLPGCWGGPTRPLLSRAGPPDGRLSGATDCGYARTLGTPELPEPSKAYQHTSAAKSKDHGQTRKVPASSLQPDKLWKLFFADKKHRA